MKMGILNESNDNYAAILKYVEDVTSKCDEMQRRVLEEILSRNAEVEYLKRYDLRKGCIDRDAFKSKVPLIKYEDLKPDIDRIIHGDFSPILCACPISELYSSTGTSGGEPKLIPSTDTDVPKRHKHYRVIMPLLSQFFKGLDSGKALSFLFIRQESSTPGGLLAKGTLTSFHKSIYATPSLTIDPYYNFTGPKEAILCPDRLQSMYAQLLCGFYQRLEVVRVDAHYAYALVATIHFLHQHYPELCDDMSYGKLSARVTDPGLRAHMQEHVLTRPEPELAQVVYNACKQESWEGIIKKIWPNTKYLEVIVTGSMAQYIPLLNYYSGGLPLVSLKYTLSEGAFGINLNPLCDPYEVSYTLMPNMAYFEFIPLKSTNDDSQPQVVDLANVQVGEEYELVVTTYNGLYRYRVEDVVSPTGFYNSTPQFKFIGRKNVLLSLHIDKTTEAELQNAVQNAYKVLRPLNILVKEYTSYAQIDQPGHYVIYFEFHTTEKQIAQDKTIKPTNEIMEDCCLTIENSLNDGYRCFRFEFKFIGPLEIRVVKHGTFDKLRDYVISRGASFGQYKVPRCVKLAPLLELLDSGVISSHFSPFSPGYSP